MTYKQLLPLHNLNFQLNRVLTHGEVACHEDELLEIAPKLQEFAPVAWFEQWKMLAQSAESYRRLMHAAYQHRMSEFLFAELAFDVLEKPKNITCLPKKLVGACNDVWPDTVSRDNNDDRRRW